MNDEVRRHYETWPYPRYSLLTSVLAQDTYALNLESLWARFNGVWPGRDNLRILLAGCGSFSPYPTSLANPRARITALDLSRRNLRRAKLHARLHGCFNITYEKGDILDPPRSGEEYGFIDSFGVIHHLADPLAGLMALERRLLPGGILRIMVYSHGARREAESIRKALRILGIRDIPSVKRLIGRADRNSRFYRYIADSYEATFDAGLADAFLHPRAVTFRIDGLMEMVGQTGLKPLLFAHAGALPEVAAEVERLRGIEKERGEEPNFILYLGRETRGGCGLASDARIVLNPVLRRCVGSLRLMPVVISEKLGRPNPPLDFSARRFLRRFLQPVRVADLGKEELKKAEKFLGALFLVSFRG